MHVHRMRRRGQVGAVVRANPLPAGRYWIWIAANKESVWLAFRVKYFGTLVIESEAATHEGYGWNETRSGTTYIFTTSEPVPWPSGIGFPNTAPATLKTADTVQRGQVPTLREEIRTAADDAAAAAQEQFVSLIVIGGLVYYFATKRGR
jgi:hypothetical protein